MKLNINNVAILGLGIFGTTLAKQLSDYGCDVIAIDQNEKNVQGVAEDVVKAVVGDYTDLELLEEIGVGECEVVIVATGTKLESAVLAVMNAKKLEVPYIIAKAKSENFENVLYTLGVDRVITPEKDSGMQLVSWLMQRQTEEILRLDDETSIVEFKIPEQWIGKTIQDLQLRQKFSINLLGIKKNRQSPLQADLHITEPLEKDILLVAMVVGNRFDFENYLSI